ncbi:MAG TPA: tRNA (adenosine(37)-N6)-threonylcarbamoyltransferase complex ATPase subunit type 1 TsaE [Gammaproteobacteria bacterium]|nr:tRNA (adenosine(37)-N6)-threonylcarbamoyltransferase complex ATPase subunit type 1 TsaE [Gammaproteobacteria bacterium]
MTGPAVQLIDEAATVAHGRAFAKRLTAGQIVYLEGALGAGKTTWVKGLLSGLGYAGVVTSPTFTLVECYTLPQLTLCHFDLYRLQDPQELEMIGFRDYLSPTALCCIEWPQRGVGALPRADWVLEFRHHEQGGRTLCCSRQKV